MANQSGGGDGLVSVNGNTGPDAVIAATDIPSTGPSTVQDDLDSAATRIGSTVVIEAWADVVREFGPDVGGVWTITKNVYQSGPQVSVPTGNRLVMTATSTWTGGHTVATLTGDIDAALMSGDLVIKGFAIGNFSVGASAKDIDAFDSGSDRFTLIESVIFLGTRGGTIHDTEGVVFSYCLHFGPLCTDGIIISGVNRGVRYSDVSSSEVGPNFGALTLDVATTFTAIGLIGNSHDLPLVTQYIFAIPFAIVMIPPSLIFMISNISFPTGAPLLRADPGDMSVDDPRIIVQACPVLPNWSAVGKAFRESVVDPLTVNLSAVNPQVVPWREGGAGLATALLGPIRCSLFQDPGDDYNTYVQYDGPKILVGATVSYALSIKRASGGTNGLRAVMERNDAPGYTGWAEVDGSSLIITNQTTYGSAEGAIETKVSPEDRFRVTVEDLDGATDALVATALYGVKAG